MKEFILFRHSQFCVKHYLEISDKDTLEKGFDLEGTHFIANFLEYEAPLGKGLTKIWYAVEEGLAVSEEQVKKADSSLSQE